MDSNITPTKSEPKDIFAHLFAVATLLISAGSLFALLFALIGIAMPDNTGYYGSYYAKDQVRSALSFLLVSFALYVWVWRMISGWEAKDVSKKEIRVRRWMVYLAIFISGLVLAGDAVALLNGYLQGDLTARFLLRVLSLAVISGIVFLWCRFLAKGLLDKRIIWSGIVLVGISLVWGFIAAGSPSAIRDSKNDEIRSSDLYSINQNIISFWQVKKTLPPSLDELYNIGVDRYGKLPVDPVSGKSYEFKVLSETSYELCAEFARDSGALMSGDAPRGGFNVNPFMSHGLGRHCFSKNIDPSFYDIYPKEVKVI
jgi:hypothetical protein